MAIEIAVRINFRFFECRINDENATELGNIKPRIIKLPFEHDKDDWID